MKRLKFLFISLGGILGVYLLFGYLVSLNMFYTPNIEQVNLAPLLTQSHLSDADYETIFRQTGLAKPMIQELQKEPDFIDTILDFQTSYFLEQTVNRTSMNAITRVDKSFDKDENWIQSFDLAPYQNGYIFLTKSTYTFNWRHGHAGLVVDAKRGKILESLEPGTTSVVKNASTWQFYPTFKMMRLKDTSQETLDEIARYALENLQDVPYNILSMKNQKETIATTHCSLLVWQAFKAFGIDLDHDGGIFVSPQNIAKSPYLETLQIFGFDPDKDW